MQNVVLGTYTWELTHSAVYVALLLLRPARPAAVPLDARWSPRRRRRPPPAFSSGAQLAQLGFSFVLAVRSSRSQSVARRDRGRCVRRRHRERAWRAGTRARSCRRSSHAKTSPGARLADVGADEPVARDRAPDRRAVYHAIRRRPGVRGQRGTYLFAVIGLLWAEYPRRVECERGRAGLGEASLRGHVSPRAIRDRARHPAHAELVLVRVGDVRRPHARDRGREPRYRSEELGVRRPLRVLRPGCRARRGERRHVLGSRAEGEPAAARLSSRSRRRSPRFALLRRPRLTYPVVLVARVLAYFLVITVALDGAPGAPRRRAAGPGHGAVDHGLRRHGSARGAGRRVG